jgi:hypothetical protein
MIKKENKSKTGKKKKESEKGRAPRRKIEEEEALFLIEDDERLVPGLNLTDERIPPIGEQQEI